MGVQTSAAEDSTPNHPDPHHVQTFGTVLEIAPGGVSIGKEYHAVLLFNDVCIGRFRHRGCEPTGCEPNIAPGGASIGGNSTMLFCSSMTNASADFGIAGVS